MVKPFYVSVEGVKNALNELNEDQFYTLAMLIHEYMGAHAKDPNAEIVPTASEKINKYLIPACNRIRERE